MKYSMIFFMIWICLIISAEEMVQNINEKYLIESEAISKDSVDIIDSKVYISGDPFSGTTYSKYDNGQLESVEHYENGFLHGSVARWYDNGQKQMEAMFRKGKLNGYFKGWFENGDLKYDLNFFEDTRRDEAIKEDEKDADSEDSVKD